MESLDFTCPWSRLWSSLKPGRTGTGGNSGKWHQKTIRFGNMSERKEAIRKGSRDDSGFMAQVDVFYVLYKNKREKIIFWTKATAFNSPITRKRKARHLFLDFAKSQKST